MPSSPKLCEVCGSPVKGRSKGEIAKKRFCSNKCSASVRKSNKTREEKISEQIDRSYKMMDGNPEKYIQHLLYKPSRKDLTVSDILYLLEVQGGRCALSGVPLTFEKKRKGPKVHTNLSIDRIDSSRGYELDNIQLVAAIINVMKSTLSNEELAQWCGKVVDRLREDI